MIRLDTLFLPDGLLWTDEFSWVPVSGASDRALDGSELNYSSALVGGRPITLESGKWIKRSDVEALQELASRPQDIYTLVLRGKNYQVRFRHEENQQPFTAQPVWPMASYSPSDNYTASLKLKTV